VERVAAVGKAVAALGVAVVLVVAKEEVLEVAEVAGAAKIRNHFFAKGARKYFLYEDYNS
jgi:hypothetical protein